MPEVELSMGPIEYEDTGGAGPVIVLVHGLLMDGAQWRLVVADLRGDFRCVLPTLPLGAHRHPMHADADLSLRGQGRIIAEFLERLDLHDVTLCFNDWCGAQVMIADGWSTASDGWCWRRARPSTTTRPAFQVGWPRSRDACREASA